MLRDAGAGCVSSVLPQHNELPVLDWHFGGGGGGDGFLLRREHQAQQDEAQRRRGREGMEVSGGGK